MKRKIEKPDVLVCAEMFNWHKHQADCLENKLQSKLSNGKPCMSGSPELWKQYEMHRRFQCELSNLQKWVRRKVAA